MSGIETGLIQRIFRLSIHFHHFQGITGSRGLPGERGLKGFQGDPVSFLQKHIYYKSRTYIFTSHI